MAAGNGEEQFHPRCGGEDRRIAIGSPAVSFWLSTPLAQIADQLTCMDMAGFRTGGVVERLPLERNLTPTLTLTLKSPLKET